MFEYLLCAKFSAGLWITNMKRQDVFLWSTEVSIRGSVSGKFKILELGRQGLLHCRLRGRPILR